jgi:hypothetical protein
MGCAASTPRRQYGSRSAGKYLSEVSGDRPRVYGQHTLRVHKVQGYRIALILGECLVLRPVLHAGCGKRVEAVAH